jgi:predicted ATPase
VLPGDAGGRTLAVDAKVPLAAYLDAEAATDESGRNVALDRHAQQVLRHAMQLGTREYWAQFQPAPEMVVLFLAGDHFLSAALAREHLQQVVALYEPQRHHALAVRCGYDPGVYAHTMEAWVLWVLGYPAQALHRSHAALTLAHAQAHPFTLALTLLTVVMLQHMRREGEATLEHVQAGVVLSTEHGFPYLTAIGTVLQGWELTRAGQVTEGLRQMREGLAAFRAMGAEILRPNLLALLADACGWGGQIEAGLEALEEALVTAEQHAERFYEAELYRLKGQLTLQKSSVVSHQLSVTDPRPLTPDPQGEAEACFLKAIEIAQKQQAKSLELRATVSLAHLWQQQGKQHEAHRMLSEIYGWFPEGFDTKDLQEAKALIEELSH